jgi:hypothetical protein
MRCLPVVAASAAFILLLSSSPTQAIVFTEVARFNVSLAYNSNIGTPEVPEVNPLYIGNNPLAIAWNGSKLYLSGMDNSGLLEAGLIEVLNPTQTGIVPTLTAADFSPRFGQLFTDTASRGYIGLELKGNRLAAAFDAGSARPESIQLFDTTNNTKVWDLSAAGITNLRGGAGVNFDPGFNGAPGGQGVSFSAFSSGRRGLLNESNGSVVYGLAAPDTLGMQWLTDPPVPGGNIARDMAFDPVTGDIYVRRSNDIDKAVRSGDNATSTRTTIVNDPTSGSAPDNKLGQKIEFLGDTSEGDLLIYNDSNTSALTQTFSNVVKVVDTNGAAKTATFNLIGGLTGADIANGAGIYDFDYDPSTNTLAIADFTNRNVHIFTVGSPVTAFNPGDFSGDGRVDGADLSLLLANWGAAVPPVPSGWVGSQPTTTGVDADELSALLANWGFGTATAIPEPASALLVSIAVVWFGAGRRRDREA